MPLNAVDSDFENQLRSVLPEALFRTETAPYYQEPRGRWAGQGLVLAPHTAQHVSQIVQQCHAARIGVVPYSGGTGLVCGQVQPEGPAPVVISLERMNKIHAVYPSENVLVCEAGCILADIQSAAADVDRLFPLSLGSEGSARIGGLLGTNAGGVNVLRYGNARAQCLGLQVVLPDGAIWDGLTRLRKDNTGYDLRDLMIGAEGTLGIITAAALKLMPRPAQQGAALMAVASPQAALDLLALAGDLVGDNISAFELIHRQGPDFIVETGLDVRLPIDPIPEWMVLIDVGLPLGLSPDEALLNLFEQGMERGLVRDGVIAQSEAQRAAFWHLRESVPIANKAIGSISSHDISVPLSKIPDFIEQGRAVLAKLGAFRLNCFGHLGDGNLHFNVFAPKGQTRDAYAEQRGAIQTAIHDLVHAHNGSISAEHGIGRLKVDDLQRYGDPIKLRMMRQIKDALDPQGLFNPGAVLPLRA